MAILEDSDYDADLLLAIEDSPQSFKFVSSKSETVDVKTGTVSRPEKEVEIKGLVETLSMLEITQSHGKFQFGDISFLARKIDLDEIEENGSFALSETDNIVFEEETYRVIDSKLDPTRRLWRFYGRKLT